MAANSNHSLGSKPPIGEYQLNLRGQADVPSRVVIPVLTPGHSYRYTLKSIPQACYVGASSRDSHARVPSRARGHVFFDLSVRSDDLMSFCVTYASFYPSYCFCTCSLCCLRCIFNISVFLMISVLLIRSLYWFVKPS